MKLSVWDVNLRTISMRRLLEWCLREHKVDRMLLVIPLKNKKYRGNWLSLVPGVPERTEGLFGPYIREQFLAAAWPGTQLIRTGTGIRIRPVRRGGIIGISGSPTEHKSGGQRGGSEVPNHPGKIAGSPNPASQEVRKWTNAHG